MALVRGRWLELLRSTLATQQLLGPVAERVSAGARSILSRVDEGLWYDEVYELAIYEAVAALRGPTLVRTLGRHAMRGLLDVVWFDAVGPLESLRGRDPSRAFGDLPRIWSLMRRDAGDMRCVEATMREATTEVRSFHYASNAPFCEAWLGQHEGLLRYFRHAGHAERVTVAGSPFILRVRTRWAGALSGVPTGGMRTSP